MSSIRSVTISVMILCFGLTFGAALQPAEARKGKACKKLKLKSPCISKNDIKANAITSNQVKNGSILFEDLSSDAVFMRTIVVSPVGPTASDNCQNLRAALDGITDNSADNPYLIKLEPGVYDCGDTSLDMKTYVDIEGSGRGITRIQGAVGSGRGVVRVAEQTELRHLSVTHLGGDFNSVRAIDSTLWTDSTPPRAENFRLTDIDATALGANAASYAIYIEPKTGKVVLSNVAAIADGSPLNYGITISDTARSAGDPETTVILRGVTAKGTGGSTSIGVDAVGVFGIPQTSVLIMNSRLTGSTASINDTGTNSVDIANSQLTGSKLGSPKCVNSYDQNLDPLDTLCE